MSALGNRGSKTEARYVLKCNTLGRVPTTQGGFGLSHR